MDIYCVNLPELWAKAIRHMMNSLDFLQPEEFIDILISMSNQGEGEE